MPQDQPSQEVAGLAAAVAAVNSTGDASSSSPMLSRRSTARSLTREQVRERMMSEIVWRFLRWCVVFLILYLVVVTAALGLWLATMMATIRDFDLPCDQPLKFYLLISFVVSGVTTRYRAQLPHHRGRRGLNMAISIGAALPGACVIAWGLHMIFACKTCPSTSPRIFNLVRAYVFFQIPYTLFVSLACNIGLNKFLIFMATLQDVQSPGCEAAVRGLPKVPTGSPELLDPDDGEVMDCCICQDVLSGERPMVRTTCTHYFHEACLAKWCQNHLDCPMCRKQVGEPVLPV